MFAVFTENLFKMLVIFRTSKDLLGKVETMDLVACRKSHRRQL